MTLSKEALEKLADIDAYTMILQKSLNELAELVERDTDEVFSMCTSACYNLQLFHKNGTYEEALDILKELADDGSVETKWEDTEGTCYKLNIDRHKVCVVLDKQKM